MVNTGSMSSHQVTAKAIKSPVMSIHGTANDASSRASRFICARVLLILVSFFILVSRDAKTVRWRRPITPYCYHRYRTWQNRLNWGVSLQMHGKTLASVVLLSFSHSSGKDHDWCYWIHHCFYQDLLLCDVDNTVRTFLIIRCQYCFVCGFSRRALPTDWILKSQHMRAYLHAIFLCVDLKKINNNNTQFAIKHSDPKLNYSSYVVSEPKTSLCLGYWKTF